MTNKRTSHPETGRDGAQPASSDSESLQGRIAAVYTGYYLVLREGREWVCKLRGRFRREARPVVGDLVDFLAHADGSGTISALHPRHSQLERRAAHRGRSVRASAQVLAANVDQLVIVASLRDPPFFIAPARGWPGSKIAGGAHRPGAPTPGLKPFYVRRQLRCRVHPSASSLVPAGGLPLADI